MAPDLNSVPASPSDAQQPPTTSTPASRRASQISPMMNLPPGSGHHQPTQPFPPLNPHPAGEPAVPMRHPRPLTAAELHHELELEQEAVVNRLTRELSSLRAHSASVASTASGVSTSGASSIAPGTDPATWGAGPTHPTGSRSRTRRSSSSVSRTSAAAHRYSMSSQQAAAAPLQQGDGGAASARSPSASASLGAGNAGASSAARYEEVAAHRHEMEEAKRENDILRKRIRELEAELRGRRASDARERSVSAVSSVGGGGGGGAELSAAPAIAAPAATAAAN